MNIPANVIHIGLQRTGNSTLQNSLSSFQDTFIYIGKRNDLFSDVETQELITRISQQDSLDYDEARAAVLLSWILVRQEAEKPVLIAAEIFSVEGRVDRRLIAAAP